MKNLNKKAKLLISFLLLPLLYFSCGDLNQNDSIISKNDVSEDTYSLRGGEYSSITIKDLASIYRCLSSFDDDVNYTADWLSDNWSDFRNYVINRGYGGLMGCIQDRFTRNGKVKCMEDGLLFSLSPQDGYAAFPGNKTIYVSNPFVENLSEFSADLKRAYIAQILSYGFSRSCGKSEFSADDIGEAAFDFFFINN